MINRIKGSIDNVSLWKKGIAIAVVPLLILISTIMLLMWYEKESEEVQSWVIHTHEVRTLIAQVYNHLAESETAVRGYVLWKDPVYLEPFSAAGPRTRQMIEHLEDIVQDNSVQKARVARLDTLVKEKLEKLNQIVKAPTLLSADDPVVVRSRTSMDEIRALVGELDKAEVALLAERNHAYQEFTKRINLFSVGLFAIALIAGLFAAYVNTAGIIRRVKQLEQYASQIMKSQPAVWTDHAKDEIGNLGASFQTMTLNLLDREDRLKQAQEQLQQSNISLEGLLEETRVANQELESFSYSVSHDLRAPLRHVAGFSELMLRNSESLDAKNRRYLDIIIGSIRQMGVLIDDLLAFSRMGRAAMKTDEVDLNATFNAVLEDLTPEMNDRKIEWAVDPLPKVKGDRMMIQLVMQNLVGNALKYSRNREVAKIIIEHKPLPESGMEQIVVTDNGVGFNMAYIDKLFGVFQRLHSNEDFEGTGIGLASVRRIIHRHGGRVSAEGELDKGAKFTFTLPSIEDGEIGE